MRDRVRPRAAAPDLAAVARRRAVAEPSWPPKESPSASSIASVASWLARRLASASVAPGREYSCSRRWACAHQRPLSRISATSLALFRAIICSIASATEETDAAVTSLSAGPW